jgi:predicted Zn-dependent protease
VTFSEHETHENTKRTKDLVYKALFVSFVLSCLSWAAQGSQAVPLTSPHWARESAIRVWTDSNGAPQGAVALVEKALQTWTRAADGRFTLSRAPARNQAAITITFISSDAIYGETVPRVDAAKRFILSADIAINATVPPDPVDARIVVYLTALHELGHALGLAHTDNFRDIMYRFQRPDDGERYFGGFKKLLTSAADIGSPTATGLSPQDVGRLRALYDR